MSLQHSSPKSSTVAYSADCMTFDQSHMDNITKIERWDQEKCQKNNGTKKHG